MSAVTGCRHTAVSRHVCLHKWLNPCPRCAPCMLSIVNCLQWFLALITQPSEEELTQLKAKAEIDTDNLIAMYNQVCSLFNVNSDTWTPE